jgi:hypothetical protein
MSTAISHDKQHAMVDDIVAKLRGGKVFEKKHTGKYGFATKAEEIEPEVDLHGKRVIVTGGYNGKHTTPTHQRTSQPHNHTTTQPHNHTTTQPHNHTTTTTTTTTTSLLTPLFQKELVMRLHEPLHLKVHTSTLLVVMFQRD